MRVSGLVSRPELDGVVCDALKFDAKTGRVHAVALPMLETRPLCLGQSFQSGRLAGTVRTFPLGGLPVLSFLSERSLPNRTLRTALGWLSHEE